MPIAVPTHMNIINLEAVPLHRVANAFSNDNNGQLSVKFGEIDPLFVDFNRKWTNTWSNFM